MDSFDICTSHNNYYLLAAALRSFFLVIVTHLLSGEVDTSTLYVELSVLPRLFWLLRYFNPLNVVWRYYSIFAYRLASGRSWSKKQLALINYEAHPCRAPVPYIITEEVVPYHVRRLEPSGFFSAQGILTLSAGYQGVLAIMYTISSARVALLPNITMQLAIIGLFRVLVYPFITSKVYVDPYEYPSRELQRVGDMHVHDHMYSRLVALGWLVVLAFPVLLSVLPFYVHPASHLPDQVLSLSKHIFYLYTTVTQIVFHAVLLWQGPRAWANRIMYFDHWLYIAQTVLFTGLLACNLVIGIGDFIAHDYYRECT